MFSLGEIVRVTSADKLRSGKGMIAMVNGDSTFDIIYTTAKGESDEESSVQADRITHLLKEEIDLHNTGDAEMWKNIGNSVFSLKDYDSAIAYYKRALSMLSTNTNSTSADQFLVGQGVIVSYGDSIDCHAGIISDINDGVADIMFDDCEREEETDITLKRLTPMASVLKNIVLQRSVYMNLARCVLKQEQKGWAIKYCSQALAVSHHLETLLDNSDVNDNETKISVNDVNKFLSDGYYFRGKALLQAHRPKFATQDCKKLRRYDTGKAASLDVEIQTFKKNVAKSNRKLARDIASWVSTAMSAEGKRKESTHSSTGREGDVDGVEDDLGVLGEDYEEEEEEQEQESEDREARISAATGNKKQESKNSSTSWIALSTSGIITGIVVAIIAYYCLA